MCDPILVTLLKMRPHYSQSSRENATPSSCTSPLASYKEVPLPPEGNLFCQKWYIKGYGVGPQGGASPYKTFLTTSPTGLMWAFFSQEIDLVYGLWVCRHLKEDINPGTKSVKPYLTSDLYMDDERQHQVRLKKKRLFMVFVSYTV